jgi:hypothetical protein
MNRPLWPLKNYEKAIRRFANRWRPVCSLVKSDRDSFLLFVRSFNEFHMNWIHESSEYGSPYKSELASLIIDIAVAFNTPPFLFSTCENEEEYWTDYAASYKEKERKFSILIDELMGDLEIQTLARQYEKDCSRFSWLLSHPSPNTWNEEKIKKSYLLAHPSKTEEDFRKDVLERHINEAIPRPD